MSFVGDYIKTSPATYIIGVTILCVSHGFVYLKGREQGLERYYQFRAVVEQTQKQAESDAERRRIESERIGLDTATGYQAAIDYWKSRSGRPVVRVLPCPGGNLPEGGAVPTPTAEPDEATAPISIDPGRCEAYINDGIRDATQVIWLQDWIRKMSEVTR